MASIPIVTILGAGRSAKWLIESLFRDSGPGFTLRVYDLARPDWADYLGDILRVDDLADADVVKEIVEASDLVVSLLPPVMHNLVATQCAEDGCHFVSASYQSQAVRDLDAQARQTGAFIISEAGLDPGIDHITALEMIHSIHNQGGKVTNFESYCGGIPAEYGRHGYKFFWNPWNVVTAGADGAKFLENGCVALRPYHLLFKDFARFGDSKGNEFEAYPNRDSIPYLDKYGLMEAQSFVRGTLRLPGFCFFWASLVDSGLTNNHIHITEEDILHSPRLSDWVPAAARELSPGKYDFLSGKLTEGDLGLTPAEVLLSRLLPTWSPTETDMDRVVMIHRISYEQAGKYYQSLFEIDIQGTPSSSSSAMSYSVSLPIYLIVKLYLNKKIDQSGSFTVMEEPLRAQLYYELTQSELGMREFTKEL